MTYQTLLDEHAEIDRAVVALIDLATGAPRPSAAAAMLEELSVLVRDHLAHEDPILYATAAAAGGTRHDGITAASMVAFEALKDDWTQYLYRWDQAHIGRDWRRFGVETAVMMEQLTQRIAIETAILYSLAVHHRALAPGG